jgi:FkbM family methyltransferase
MAKSLAHYWKVLQWTLKHYRPEHDVTIETANGRLSVSNKDWLIGKHLFVRRDYELDFIRRTIAFLRGEGLLKEGKNRTVVDLGANVGMICIALLREGFFENAIAFEPSPRSFRLLEKNVAQNGFGEKIRCFPLALSSSDGEIEFELAADNSGDSRVKSTSEAGAMGEQKRETVAVKAKTFDSFLDQNPSVNAAEIDLIWIDIQGHEGHFFEGAKQFFSERKIPVVNEFWGYGISRSGMSREEYCRAVGEIFSGFYHFTGGGFELKSIAEIERLFDVYRRPREIANIILV